MKFDKLTIALTKPFDKGGLTRQAGMTIIEILIVIAIMGTVMALVVTNLTDTASKANEDTTRLGMGQVFQGMQAYKINNFRYPTTEQGLQALVRKPSSGAKRWRGPYIDESKLSDTWGVPYEYESDGKNFKIISAGEDGVVGNEDDLSYPEESPEDDQ